MTKQCAMHYYAIDPLKIIEQIERREKRNLAVYREEAQWRERGLEIWRPSVLHSYIPTIDEKFEQVIVKQWSFGISVYPVLTTEYQVANETWVKNDTRENSIAQKYGNLFVEKDMNIVYLEYWKQGKLICDEDCDFDLVEKTFQNTLRTLESKVVLDVWKKNCPNDDLVQNAVEIPLLLPDDWEHIWEKYKQTRLTTYCK